MLRQRLSQKQIQKLSPQQIQLMKLLQIPTAVLEQRIKEELEANPALEEGSEDENDEVEEANETETETDSESETEEPTVEEETIDLTDYMDDDDLGYISASDGYNKDEEDKTIPVAVPSTFHDQLIQQLGLLDLTEHEVKVAEQIVGSIDDDGYIRRELEAIIDDLAFTQNVDTTVKELEHLLEVVQKFEPAGVGARTLQECLILQIERKGDKDPAVKAAHKILQGHFEAFTKKHYEKLMRQMDVSEEDLKDAIDEILKLNPKPGGSLQSSRSENQYIIPDFIVKNTNNELEILLNARNAPDLRISDSFREMMAAYNRGDKKDKKQKDTVIFIKQKIDSAKWFIDAIKQRQHTLLSTMQSIVAYQEGFFLTGDETKLKPMILKDIAEITGLDISTVSRVANSKYVQTEYGTIKLKYFFSESLQTESGEEVSTREVKNILQGMIEGENKGKPLSDQKLTDMLKEKGYNIARRTVAKYREQLNIPGCPLAKGTAMRVAAKAISAVFHPLLLATWVVLLFGTMNKYAFGAAPVNKMAVIVFFNTFFFPAVTFLMMYVLGFIPDLKMADKQDRTIPFFAAQIFYIWSFLVVKQMQMPVFLQLFILGATISISMAFVVNIFSKVSLHMVGMGGVVMLLILVVFTGAIDVGNFLPILIIIAGLVGTARLVENAHTITELYYGFLIGVLGQMIGLIAFNRMGIIGM